MILQFTGEHRWLSNFYPVEVKYNDLWFPSVEHAYQAAKKIYDEQWVDFVLQNSVGDVKRKSRELNLSNAEKISWSHHRTLIMFSLLIQKFNKEPFKTKLLQTGNCLIEEGNSWGDCFWGVDKNTRVGNNTLGKIIMKIRENMHNDDD